AGPRSWGANRTPARRSPRSSCGARSRQRPGIDERFRDAHVRGVLQRLVQTVERIRALADGAPRYTRRVVFEELQCAKEMPWLASPAAPDVEVLPVDLMMHVDLARTRVGLWAGARQR